MRKPVGRLQLEPGAAALLLVRRDPVPPRGAHGGQPKQRPGGVLQRLGAVLADVDADSFRMKVTAIPAPPRRPGDQAVLTLFGRGQRHADYLIASTFVVDDRAGAELGDANEP